MVGSATAKDVAQWMAQQIASKGHLDQEDAADGIEQLFGKDFTYLNDNGNSAIEKAVLREFRRLTETTVVWDRWDRSWRKRLPNDAPGRQQD